MGRTNIGRRVMRFSKIRFSATQLSNRNKVEFETTVDGGNGKFVVEVERDFAPQGSDRFFSLVENGFYNEAGFFRVVPNFVVQFGLAADPAMTEKWKKVIPDDPKNREIGNKRGTISFATAGKNTRTTQLFINLGDNDFLDNLGFTPIGRVIEGMEVVEKINSQYTEKPNQGEITMKGNAYLKQKFPKLDYISKARLID